MKTKIFAMYLPQFHEIEENNKFWGKGYTDWVAVKNAKPLYKNHQQPKHPQNDYYYDLSLISSVKWQAKIAKEYGVDGFGIYHYWFNDEQNLLAKPAEILLNNADIDINFFFAWDNISWKRTWSGVPGNDWCPVSDNNQQKETNPILIEYRLGQKNNWKKHFDYLLPYFKDSRYEKKNNKPLFVIFHYSLDVYEMVKYWNELAIEYGFSGIEVIYRYEKSLNIPSECPTFKYEPCYCGWNLFLSNIYNRIFNILKLEKIRKYNFDKIWKRIIKRSKNNNSNYYSGFVNYDDTPRRGKKGRVVTNGSVKKFGLYLSKLVDIANKNENSYIFLTAWNEWGEGAYLEPDSIDGFGYLEAIKKIKNGGTL